MGGSRRLSHMIRRVFTSFWAWLKRVFSMDDVSDEMKKELTTY
jgi:hypothetical protein